MNYGNYYYVNYLNVMTNYGYCYGMNCYYYVNYYYVMSYYDWMNYDWTMNGYLNYGYYLNVRMNENYYYDYLTANLNYVSLSYENCCDCYLNVTRSYDYLMSDYWNYDSNWNDYCWMSLLFHKMKRPKPHSHHLCPPSRPCSESLSRT
jgi:hypothetical protein